MKNKAKIIINSFLITFILISFVGFSFVAVYNTSKVVYGQDAKILSIENQDNKYTLSIFDNQYKLNLNFIEKPLQLINEIPFIIPNAFFYLGNIYEFITDNLRAS